MEGLDLSEECIRIASLTLPVRKHTDELALNAMTADVVPANVVAVLIQCNPRYQLKVLSVADTDVVVKVCALHVLRGVAHQMHVAALDADPPSRASRFVRFKLE